MNPDPRRLRGASAMPWRSPTSRSIAGIGRTGPKPGAPVTTRAPHPDQDLHGAVDDRSPAAERRPTIDSTYLVVAYDLASEAFRAEDQPKDSARSKSILQGGIAEVGPLASRGYAAAQRGSPALEGCRGRAAARNPSWSPHDSSRERIPRCAARSQSVSKNPPPRPGRRFTTGARPGRPVGRVPEAS
jgi:hypothetical protein